MYMGIQTHRQFDIAGYDAALAVFTKRSKTPTGKDRKPMELYGDGGVVAGDGAAVAYPLGLTKRGQTKVIKYPDDSVAFRLYETDVVTWHPDNSVVIENYGTATTSGFARSFLPGGIHLRHPTSTRGRDGGDKGITYAAGDGSWSDRRICSGDYVRFHEVDGMWVPDESTLDTMGFLVVDHKLTRGITARFNLKDFELWLPAAAAHLDLEHDGFDVEECMAALEARDFRLAAAYLPTVKIPNGWGADRRIKPLRFSGTASDRPITMGSLRKLRVAIWDALDMINVVEHTTVSLRDHDRLMARAKEVCQLRGDYGCGYGAGS